MQELSKSHVETIDLELGLYRSQRSMKDLSAEERSRLSEARRLEQAVNPASVLPVGGIEPILQSGQFRVSGQAFFRPLQPFDPSSEIPSSDERFVSIEEIEFSYP